MNNPASALTGIRGDERVALSDVSVSAVLRDLLAEVRVSQTYRNDEQINIEAVYTFPLPLDAVLLELQVEIGGRTLKGVVAEKKSAEEKYEDAVAAGDAAVMLEQLESGLFTLNVGNLLPGEKATITFKYALLYRWSGDRLRFFLPTTVAPRYGESPHRPHQVPEASLTVENMFSLQIEFYGSLREAQFVCPSHPVEINSLSDKTVISLTQAKATMDRDFILNVKAPQAARSFVLSGADGEGMAAVASFQPFFPGLQQPRPLNLAIVIDCSGSMAGNSIEQARQALAGMLAALQVDDRVTLIAFGGTTNLLWDRLLPCNSKNLAKARKFAKQLDSNMGGTEIGMALQDTYAAVRGSESADIFLVTDGEVSDWAPVVDEARRSGNRIFTVGVGTAVSEAFVRDLADATGGSCELVAPTEGMADRVIRHFERMRAPRAKRVAIHWPEGANGIAPAGAGAVFEGDTVISSAQFAHSAISGLVILEVETEHGEVMRQELPLPITPLSESVDRMSGIARLAASLRIQEVDARAGLETALRYQLISPWTNCLVIAERPEGEKLQNLPELRKVPQTLAAGWGGVGAIEQAFRMTSLDKAVSSSHQVMSGAIAYNDFDLVSELSQQSPGTEVSNRYRRLLALIEAAPERLDIKQITGLLREAGIDSDYSDLFRSARQLGLSTEFVALILLTELLSGALGQQLSRERQRDVDSLRSRALHLLEHVQNAAHDLEVHGKALIQVAKQLNASNIIQFENVQYVTQLMHQSAQMIEFLNQIKHKARGQIALFNYQEDYDLLDIPDFLRRQAD